MSAQQTSGAAAGVRASTRWRNSIAVLLICARMQIIELKSTWVVIAIAVIQPVAFLLIALVPSADRSASAATPIVLGVALSVSWSATAWGAASVLRRERAMGTLARALAGLVDARLIVLGKGLGASVASTVAGLLVVAVAVLALRQPIRLDNPGCLLLGLLVLFASGSAVGLLIGSVFVLSRYGGQISAILVYPVLLLGGMLVPLSYLPAPVRALSWVFSLRWLQQFLASSAHGSPDWPALVVAVLLTAGYALAGAALFSVVARKARRDGTISLY